MNGKVTLWIMGIISGLILLGAHAVVDQYRGLTIRVETLEREMAGVKLMHDLFLNPRRQNRGG